MFSFFKTDHFFLLSSTHTHTRHLCVYSPDEEVGNSCWRDNNHTKLSSWSLYVCSTMSLKLWNPLILAQTTKMFSVLIIQKNNSTKSSKYFQNTEKMKINARGNGKKTASSCAMAKRPQTTAWRCKTHNKSWQEQKIFPLTQKTLKLLKKTTKTNWISL